MKTIASILNGDSAAKDKAFAEGLYAAGTRYVLAKADDEEGLYGRSVSNHLFPISRARDGPKRIAACDL